MEKYSVINVEKRQHVVCSVNPRGNYLTGEKMPEANYLNTGMALCGVIEKGKSLKNWKGKRSVRAAKRNN